MYFIASSPVAIYQRNDAVALNDPLETKRTTTIS